MRLPDQVHFQGSDHQIFPIDMKMVTSKAPALAEHLKECVERCGIGRLTGVPAPVVESALRYGMSRNNGTIIRPFASPLDLSIVKDRPADLLRP